MTFNPILALEVRARWRAGRSFLLLLGVGAALSLLALFVYGRATQITAADAYDPMSGAYVPAIRNFNLRAFVIGRQLFGALAHANIVCWLLIAAASAATGIARERERGLLESLQLSPLSARGQIAARFGAGLLLLLCLQLVLTPIYSVAFLMGGVAPLDIAGAFYLVLWSSVLGTSIGLWFSARSHRPTNALFGALGAIALFSAVVYFGGESFAYGVPSFGWEPLWFFHPSALFWALATPDVRTRLSLSDLLWIESLLWFIFSALLLWSATRHVNRTLAPPAWQRNSAWVEKLKAQQSLTPRQSKASGALLADLPLDRFVHFSDPLLAREVKARFRLRRTGFWVGLVRFALFLLGAGTWLFEVFWLTDAPSRAAMAPYALRALLYGGTLTLGVLAATSWTRERESGTWESLKLSLLQPREILRAKWMSPLVSFGYYALPILILLPVGALFISFSEFLMGAFIVICWLGLAVALGLWVSWRARNGTASIAWTTGILAALLIGWPWLNDLAGVDNALATAVYGTAAVNSNPYNYYYYGNGYGSQPEYVRTFENNLRAWHPGEALNRLFYETDTKINPALRYGRQYPPGDRVTSNFASTLFPLALTALLLALLRRDVKREQLKS